MTADRLPLGVILIVIIMTVILSWLSTAAAAAAAAWDCPSTRSSYSLHGPSNKSSCCGSTKRCLLLLLCCCCCCCVGEVGGRMRTCNRTQKKVKWRNTKRNFLCFSFKDKCHRPRHMLDILRHMADMNWSSFTRQFGLVYENNPCEFFKRNIQESEWLCDQDDGTITHLHIGVCNAVRSTYSCVDLFYRLMELRSSLIIDGGLVIGCCAATLNVSLTHYSVLLTPPPPPLPPLPPPPPLQLLGYNLETWIFLFDYHLFEV